MAGNFSGSLGRYKHKTTLKVHSQVQKVLRKRKPPKTKTSTPHKDMFLLKIKNIQRNNLS